MSQQESNKQTLLKEEEIKVGDKVLYRRKFPAEVIATPVPVENRVRKNTSKRNESAKKYPEHANFIKSASQYFYALKFTTDETPQNSKVMKSVHYEDIKNQTPLPPHKKPGVTERIIDFFRRRGGSKKTRKASRKTRKGTYRKRR